MNIFDRFKTSNIYLKDMAKTIQYRTEFFLDSYYDRKYILTESLEGVHNSYEISKNKEVRSFIPAFLEKINLLCDRRMIQIIHQFVHNRLYAYSMYFEDARITDDKWIPYGEATSFLCYILKRDTNIIPEYPNMGSFYLSESDLYHILVHYDVKSRIENTLIEEPFHEHERMTCFTS